MAGAITLTKTNSKRLGILLLAAACALSTGCSAPEEAAGTDWRTWGLVQTTGVITRDGTNTPVCVCVHDDSAVFYLDQPEQVRFDGVIYPEALADGAASFSAISFDDLDGDGNSDVRMDFAPGGAMIWYWSEADGYVYQSNP